MSKKTMPLALRIKNIPTLGFFHVHSENERKQVCEIAKHLIHAGAIDFQVETKAVGARFRVTAKRDIPTGREN